MNEHGHVLRMVLGHANVMVAFWCVGNGVCGNVGMVDGPGMNGGNAGLPSFDLGQLRYEIFTTRPSESLLADLVFLLPLVRSDMISSASPNEAARLDPNLPPV